MAYQIMINEEQRLALIEILANLPTNHYETAGAPLEFWTAMLEELPEIEAKHPGVLHGFCL